ncbi:MAG: response regulator, partial [Thermostichales cyanobacterium BF4_bins_65]
MNRVFVVEDSRTDAELISLTLQKAGFSVTCVGSGEEAEEKLQAQKPNLILVDVILPGESGFELCRKLKANPTTQGIPVVICSTKNTELDKTWGRMGGADAYLTKPVDPQELVETVKRWIR